MAEFPESTEPWMVGQKKEGLGGTFSLAAAAAASFCSASLLLVAGPQRLELWSRSRRCPRIAYG
jgi:hypothetical protein